MDAVARDAGIGAHVQPDNAAILGHSMGGYAALAVAGGLPWTKDGQHVDVAPDPRGLRPREIS